jgi:phosphoribosyl-ATP pyrophosphohydrolase
MSRVLVDLYNLAKQRKADPIIGSYTCYLFEKGLDKILKKVGEECAETIVAAKNGDKQEIIYEMADVIYHLIVMLVELDVDFQEVLDHLEARSAKIGNLKPMRETDTIS